MCLWTTVASWLLGAHHCSGPGVDHARPEALKSCCYFLVKDGVATPVPKALAACTCMRVYSMWAVCTRCKGLPEAAP